MQPSSILHTLPLQVSGRSCSAQLRFCVLYVLSASWLAVQACSRRMLCSGLPSSSCKPSLTKVHALNRWLVSNGLPAGSAGVDDEPVVTEVSPGSAAEAAGCRPGDVVRATSAMTMQMVYPTVNIMFGGVGRPTLAKILLPTSKAPFHKVLDAVRSNSTAQGGDGSITLILERRDAAPPSATGSGSSSSSGGSSSSSQVDVEGDVAAAGADTGEDGATFDPKIFE
eukprot:GHRQ01016475.1.p1 GENE.GHRQ01016475.1~~GHRQ01016475.1.p1  ORF type:complete len:225 (+),score=86.40 GHRQ01016475.1:72-746(+)